MKSMTVITAAVCCLLISTLIAEDQQMNNSADLVDFNTNISLDDVFPDPISSSDDLENLDSSPVVLGVDQLHQYLAEGEKNKQENEQNDDEENEENEENEGSENEEENEESENEESENEEENKESENQEDYVDENEEEYWERKHRLEMEHLNHQANLFSDLNLDDKFNDLSVSLEEEIEDMIRVLGNDDSLPLREIEFHHLVDDVPQNASQQQTDIQKSNEYGPIEHLSDDYSDIDRHNPFFHKDDFN